MESYPKREKFHAMKLTRLLLKSCAAQTIGRDACLLVAYIASTEDSARYQYPVTFWNSQLEAILGFDHPRQLWLARKQAVENGWLFYRRSSNRSVGEYWSVIPAHVSKFNDLPVEDNHSTNGMNQEVNLSTNGMNSQDNHSTNGMNCGMNSTGNHSTNGKPSYPKEDPNPKDIIPNCVRVSESESDHEGKAAKPSRKPKAPKPTPQRFNDFWKAYPVRKAKASALKAYAKAVAAVAAERSVSQDEAESAILKAAGRYASECRSKATEQQFIKHPATWLNQGCWDDEPESTTSKPADTFTGELLPVL